jgi:hypothetical protein
LSSRALSWNEPDGIDASTPGMPTRLRMGDMPWSGFHRRWSRLAPPLRPHPDVCFAVRKLIRSDDSRVLLLGVTPEFSDLGCRTVAVDGSTQSLSLIWPGNGPTRRAVRGNWLSLPCAGRSFSAAVGDGSFNCLQYPLEYRKVLDELARVVRPGGPVAVRLYLTPDRAESIAAIRDRTMAGRVGGIHALKWLLANALCAERRDPNLRVQCILAAFNRMFPDRAALGRATGWAEDEIAQVDAYERMPDVFSFPTAQQAFAVIPNTFANPRLRAVGAYELAERCPVLVMDVAS